MIGKERAVTVLESMALVPSRYTLACLSLGPSLEGVYIEKKKKELSKKDILLEKKERYRRENISRRRYYDF